MNDSPSPSAPSESEAFIAQFLAAGSPAAAQEIATLAAMLHRPDSKFEASKLVERAVTLRDAAIAAAAGHRARLLAGADPAHIADLYTHLETQRCGVARPDDGGLRAVNATLDRLNARAAAEWEASPEREAQRAAAEAHFAEVERASGPRPAAGRPLEEVLPWCAGAAPSVPAGMLAGAFTDFLSFLAARDRLRQINRRGPSEAEEWFARHQATLREEDLTPEQRAHAGRELARCAETRDRERREEATLANHLNAVTPGRDPRPPRLIAEEGERAYETHWRGKAVDEEHLRFLSTDFRAWWRDHQAYYLELERAERETRETLARQKEEAGKKGAAGKSRQRWVVFLEDFARWREGRPVSPELIAEFPKQPDTSKRKADGLLRTLHAAARREVLPRDLAELLEAEGITVTEELAAELFDRFARDVAAG